MGTILDYINYDSFGEILFSSAAPPRFAYTGQEYDAASRMYYYNARYYDPNVGRFISQDPIGFDAGDSNLYRYVGNNSPNEEDPTGMNATQNSYAAQDQFAVLMRPGPNGTVSTYLAAKADPEPDPTTSISSQPTAPTTPQPFDLGKFYSQNKNSNGTISAVALINVGRSLQPGQKVDLGDAPPDIMNYVAHGYDLKLRSQDDPGPRLGYADEFGYHMSFCMSCHDRTSRDTAFKMQAALTTVNSSWGVFLARDVAPVVIPLGAQLAAAKTASAEVRVVMEGSQAAGIAEDNVMSLRGAAFSVDVPEYLTGRSYISLANMSKELPFTYRLPFYENVRVPLSTSEVTHGFSNLGNGYTAANAATLNEFGPRSVFSGVYNPTSKQFLLHPSGDTRLLNGSIPQNLVPRSGGHGIVNQRFSAMTGVDPTSNVGFNVFLEEDGSVSFSWRSGSVNGRNPSFSGIDVPEHMRPQIIHEVSTAIGRNARP